jgi:hypothetical protein
MHRAHPARCATVFSPTWRASGTLAAAPCKLPVPQVSCGCWWRRLPFTFQARCCRAARHPPLFRRRKPGSHRRGDGIGHPGCLRRRLAVAAQRVPPCPRRLRQHRLDRRRFLCARVLPLTAPDAGSRSLRCRSRAFAFAPETWTLSAGTSGTSAASWSSQPLNGRHAHNRGFALVRFPSL